MTEWKTVDLDAVKTFYDPQPGFNTIVPLPAAVKNAVAGLVGLTMTLREAIARLQATTDGRVEASRHYDDLLLWIVQPGRFSSNEEVLFVLIRYRDPEETPVTDDPSSRATG